MLAKPFHVCLIAGEPSGDALGASLLRAMRSANIMVSGIGGPKMEDEGLQSLFPIDDLAVMGIAEVLPRLKTILGRIDEAADYIEQAKPDVVVTIDSPDFCFRVLKKVRDRMGANAPKLIHYVAPTVWAWREGRARKIAGFLDGLICLFDFEPPYFEKEGLRSIAVGHPVVETEAMTAQGRDFREKYGIQDDQRVVGIFFGSRHGELRRHGEIFRDVMATMPGGTQFVIPTLPHLKEHVQDIVEDLDAPIIITTDKAEKWQAFAACNAALAVSGTIGLELAVARVPHIIAYRTSPLTYEIARHMVKVKYIHLMNIMLGRPVVPEFIQRQCKVETISGPLLDLITGNEARQTQMKAFGEFARRIGAAEETPPSKKAADFILSFRK